MTVSRNYAITDFPNDVVSADVLKIQIVKSAISVELTGINVDGPSDNCEVIFETEPTGADDTILDGLVADHTSVLITKIETGEHLKAEILPANYAAELIVSSTAAGLVITTTVSELDIDDETTVVADETLTKYVLISLVYNSTSDTFGINAYEKTDGEYDSLDADEYLVQQDVSEWYVVANGDTLIEVE